MLKLEASLMDVQIMVKDCPDTWPAKRWPMVLEFIRDNFDLPNLCVSVDLSMLERWRLDDGVPEKSRRDLYKYYRFITSRLCILKTVKDVHFELVWAAGLAPWMRREILGERFRSKVRDPDPGSSTDSVGGVPYWHRNDERVSGSNFCGTSS
jgi:hypothetical protein